MPLAPQSPARAPGSPLRTQDLSGLVDRGAAGLTYLSALEHHPTLAPLTTTRSEAFDAAAFAAQVMRDSGGSAAVSKSRAEVVVGQLTEQLDKVEEAIERHIFQHQQRLMQSMGDLGELKENCDVLTIRSKELRRSINKLSNELLEPYQSTELRTHQLRRIHAANDLLKKVSRFSATLARLRKGPLQGLELDLTTGVGAASGAALAGLDTRELAQAAAHLHELEGLVQDPSLSGITVIAADRAYVAALGKALRQAAQRSLQGALKSMNPAELGPALQVFYNLQSLPAVVLESVSAIVAEAREATARALDPQALERVAAAAAADGAQQQRAASPPSTAASSKGGAGVLGEVEAIALRQRRARFREHCNQWAAALGHCAVRVWHLQRVLAKQVDAVTNERFLDVLLRSDAFHQAQERATVSFAATTAAGTNTSAASLSLSRSAIGRSSSQLPPPPPVGPLYWVFWLEATAAVRKIAVTAAGKKMPQQQQQQLVKSYPYLSLASLGLLQRLADSTAKHGAGGGLAASALPATGGVAQGNPLAMRALVEALGAPLNEGQEQQAGGDGGGALLLAEVGASPEERDALLGALGSLRELYLSEALQRLRRPIEQMFPQVEGYQAAMPSKHDLQAFCRAAQAELLGGLAEGGPLLLPVLARGVGEAVDLFCGKVGAMMKTGESARKLYPLRGWALSPEKEHNLQLLQLVAFLHQALRRLPKDLAAAASSSSSSSLSSSGSGGGAAVGSGSLGDRELQAACAALEALAVGGFIQPYLADIANELGGVLAEMHLENYAPKGEAPAAPGGVDETSSRFVASFQTAVAGLRKHHLSRFPTQAEFALRGLQWLAGRILRTYVSHAALVRPLNNRGKAKLSHDMATLETALSSIYPKVSELGAPYHELRAFRELCFFGDEQNPVTVAGLLKEQRLTAHLRPSTLLDALFARAPLEMSSPHVLQRCSERTLVEELLALYYGDTQPPSQQQGQQQQDPRLGAETAHWQVVQVCLDAYAQRMSAAQAEPAYLYDVMLNLGPALLKAWGERLGREQQQRPRGEAAAAGSLPLAW